SNSNELDDTIDYVNRYFKCSSLHISSSNRNQCTPLTRPHGRSNSIGFAKLDYVSSPEKIQNSSKTIFLHHIFSIFILTKTSNRMQKIVYYVASSIDGYISGVDEDISQFIMEGDGVDKY